MLGNMRFIGELFKSKLLTEKIMHECIIKLLGVDTPNPDLDEVECLVKLLTSIGSTIDHARSKEYMDAYFNRIRDMSKNDALPNRVRFMLQEIIELRRGAWKQRKADPSLKAAAPSSSGPAAAAAAAAATASARARATCATRWRRRRGGRDARAPRQGHGRPREGQGRRAAVAGAAAASEGGKGGGKGLASAAAATRRRAAAASRRRPPRPRPRRRRR